VNPPNKPKTTSRTRRLIAVAVGLALLLVGAGAAILVIHLRRPGNIFHPHVEFQPKPTVEPSLAAAPNPPWPLYGYSKDHTRTAPAPPTMHPPFRRIWTLGGPSLLEFPPVLDHGILFQIDDGGLLRAITAATGKVVWQKKLGTLAASSPAASGQSVYVTLLEHGQGPAGKIVALRQSTGQIRWARDLPSRTESSPLLDRGRIYFGSEDGTVYALNAHNGARIWDYHAGGAVKASPTLSNRMLYFGDYSGHVQAISETTGKLVWINGGDSILGDDGTFYSTAAVVFGRVFLGNTDGRVYAFDAATGKLAWAHQTGSYVYSSPAVTDVPGLGDTVFIGSYDGTMYALSAFSGSVRWSDHIGGRISGSPTILGPIVYFADLGLTETFALGLKSGAILYRRHSGSFDPVISDGTRIYMSGITGLYGLVPTGHRHPKKKAA
jgi:outer membrane protein assembly factor BamB